MKSNSINEDSSRSRVSVKIPGRVMGANWMEVRAPLWPRGVGKPENMGDFQATAHTTSMTEVEVSAVSPGVSPRRRREIAVAFHSCPFWYLPKSFSSTSHRNACGSNCHNVHGTQTKGTESSHVKHAPVIS